MPWIKILEDGDKFTVAGVLSVGIAGIAWLWTKGKLISGETSRTQLQLKDALIADLKEQLADLKADRDERIERLESDRDGRIEKLESDLAKWQSLAFHSNQLATDAARVIDPSTPPMPLLPRGRA